MIYHLDALTTREASPKFRAITGFVRFDRIPHDYVKELAVLLATPGFRPIDVHRMFAGGLQKRTVKVVTELELDVGELAKANAASVTEGDAKAMLWFLVGQKATPSAWSRAWLRDKDVNAVAGEYGVDVAVVRWWRRGGEAIRF